MTTVSPSCCSFFPAPQSSMILFRFVVVVVVVVSAAPGSCSSRAWSEWYFAASEFSSPSSLLFPTLQYHSSFSSSLLLFKNCSSSRSNASKRPSDSWIVHSSSSVQKWSSRVAELWRFVSSSLPMEEDSEAFAAAIVESDSAGTSFGGCSFTGYRGGLLKPGRTLAAAAFDAAACRACRASAPGDVEAGDGLSLVEPPPAAGAGAAVNGFVPWSCRWSDGFFSSHSTTICRSASSAGSAGEDSTGGEISSSWSEKSAAADHSDISSSSSPPPSSSPSISSSKLILSAGISTSSSTSDTRRSFGFFFFFFFFIIITFTKSTAGTMSKFLTK